MAPARADVAGARIAGERDERHAGCGGGRVLDAERVHRVVPSCAGYDSGTVLRGMKRTGRCDECGFDWDSEPAPVITSIATAGARFADALAPYDDESVRARPAPDV